MPMSFRAQTVDGVLVVEFTDVQILDATVIEQMHRDLMGALEKAREKRMLLDFSHVQFMSSAALGMLIRVHKKCKELKIALKLCSIAPQIYQVFRVTNLDRVFDIHKDGKATRPAWPDPAP